MMDCVFDVFRLVYCSPNFTSGGRSTTATDAPIPLQFIDGPYACSYELHTLQSRGNVNESSGGTFPSVTPQPPSTAPTLFISSFLPPSDILLLIYIPIQEWQHRSSPYNMAAAGKKKKARWVAASITDIIAQPTTIPTSQNWADSVDEELESYGYSSHTRAPVVLPSASRAARGGLAVDEESIPKRPPFVAYISNLPYDVDETAITELFDGLKIQNLRLPREGDRLKGYGYVDFEDRESLIDAMNIPDLTIGGRRIRIDVSTNDNDRRMGNRGRSDRDREYDPERTMGDWRSGPRSVPEAPSRRPMDRDRERDRDRDGDSSADNRPGGWRDGERPAAEPARTPYGGRDSYGRDRDRYDDRYGDRDRGFGRDREGDRGYGGRDGFRTADRGFSRDGNRGFGERRGFGDRDRDPPRDEPSKPRERPKLNLLPRTVMREEENTDKPAARPASADSVFGGAKPVDTASKEREIEERLRKQTEEPSAPKPVSAEKVFGGAKPVDTAAKEREIEERLLKQQEQESRRGTDDRERWPRRVNDVLLNAALEAGHSCPCKE
ncbi:Eukaryotic translation initiation factor 4B [Eumeta japonica]|uniref:Eukaryotic translation initiation factor 4B n=1 Tax=Eumeta variegata TaxID=151549 RepID=A0A4C1TN89_EUMVA|nr:Eukaryotic translation initiation factor 4B [Eumeta japonica]